MEVSIQGERIVILVQAFAQALGIQYLNIPPECPKYYNPGSQLYGALVELPRRDILEGYVGFGVVLKAT